MNMVRDFALEKAVKKRLNKLDRMTLEQRAAEAIKFWAAPDDALFTPEIVAVVLGMSLSWLQNKRCGGDGIPFFKPDGKKIIFYQKSDVTEFINKNKLAHTA